MTVDTRQFRFGNRLPDDVRADIGQPWADGFQIIIDSMLKHFYKNGWEPDDSCFLEDVLRAKVFISEGSAAGVPYFLNHGGDPEEWPADLLVRQWPEGKV